MQKRFVSWAAVSSLPQAKKISLQEQKETNQRHIERHGGMVVAALEVPGESRDIVLFDEACERIEAYRQLRDLIKQRAFDVLVCLNRSRLGRTLALVETIAELCRRAKILIYETESPPSTLAYRGDTHDDLLLGAIKSAGAQREVAEIQRRHQMGMLGKFRRGEFLTTPPYGWITVYNSDGTSRVEVNEEAASLIRLILLELGLNRGMSFIATAKELNALGYKTPRGKAWSPGTVSKIWAMARRYAGYGEINAYSKTSRPYAREKGAWPKIISEQELEKLLNELELRNGTRKAASTYRFSTMVWCKKCNVRMRMQYVWTTNKRADGTITSRFKHIVAGCPGAKPKHRNSYISVTKVYRAVERFILLLQDKENWGKHLRDTSQDMAVLDKKLEIVQASIEQAHVGILQADDHFMDGKFDAERHARQVKRLKDKILQLQHEATVLHDKKNMLKQINNRQDRLQELADKGMDYLQMEDEKQANAKLRPLVRIWAQGGRITEVEVL